VRRELERAVLLRRRGDVAGAESLLRRVLRRDPLEPDALNLMGLNAIDARDYPAAIRWLKAALAARNPHLDALVNLAVVLNRTGQHELARRSCLAVLAHAPHHPLAWVNLGLAHKSTGRLTDAKLAFIEAWELPIARFNLGCMYLLENDLERGLPLHEQRKAVLGIGTGLTAPEWDGSPMPDRTLLVVPERGLGDTLLMCRFYPRLLEAFGRVVAHVQPPLERLIAESFPGVQVVTDVRGVAYDAWCGHMSLPLRLGIRSVDQLPLAPWLRLDAPRTPRLRPRVGLNWAGNPSFACDFVRSTHLETLGLLLRVTDVEWCSLNVGHRAQEAECYRLPQPLAGARDFLDTARVIQGLDLVISTETAVPNLSAAMGVRTCVLASPDVDWRWRRWYPGVTVCAQDEPGNWYGPIAKALEVLRDELTVAAV